MNFEAGGFPLLGAGIKIPGLSSPKVSLSVSYEPPNKPSSLFTLKEGEMMTGDVNVNLMEFSTFVGDSNDVDHWQYQGMTNACMFAAAASSINSYNYNQGTYQEVMGVRVWVPKSWTAADGTTHYFPFDDSGREPGVQVYYPTPGPDGVQDPIPQEITIAHLVALSTGEITVAGVPVWGGNTTPIDELVDRSDYENLTPEQLIIYAVSILIMSM